MAPEYTGCLPAYVANSEISYTSDSISSTSNASASSYWGSSAIIQAESSSSSTSFGKNYYEGSVNSTDSSSAVQSPVATNLYPTFARQASPSLNDSSTETQKHVETEQISFVAKPTKLSRKHQLPDRAVEIMNEWFEEHENNPYPQLCEKEIMAQRGGISIKQVTAWFSNRRNRSQNTKPKRMQRVIKENFNKICQELAYNPDRDLVAEKVRHFQETLEKRYWFRSYFFCFVFVLIYIVNIFVNSSY